MGASNPTTDISGYIQDIYEDAWAVARDQAIMPRLVTVFTDTNDEAKPRVSSTWSSATISAIGELDDLSSQAFTPSEVSELTPAEAGGQFFLPDKRLSADPFALRQAAALELGAAMAAKINSDLLGDFSSFTGGSVGSAGTTITWGYWQAGRSQLRNAKAPMPYRCVLHTYQWHALAKAASIAATTAPGAPAFQDEVTRQWFVERVSNVDLFESADVPEVSTDAYGGIFNPLALALDMRRAPRLEAERDASKRGWELNFTAAYAHGVWRPEWGVWMLFAIDKPTS